jgi:hypothetical protein
MPRKKIGPDRPLAEVKKDLVEKLAAELKNSQDRGEPVIYEHAFRTGKVRVIVMWDAWEGVPLQQRSATILRAYEMAEGPESQDRIALASGLTVPEAHAAGMLPYQIITAIRKGDPVTPEQARTALLEEGGSSLFHWNAQKVELRFATADEAEAARMRLIQRYPGTDDVWIIDREVTGQDLARAQAEE